MKKEIKTLVVLGLMLLPLCLFTGGIREEGIAHAAASKLDTLMVAVPALPDTLEPGQTITIARYRVSYNVFNNLMEFDFKGTKGILPALAESWKQVDGKTLEVKLRKGVLFHNGDELTSEDVAFTFSDERLMGPKPAVGSTKARGYWTLFDRVEVVDRYTVRFHTKDSDPVAANRLSLPAFQIVNKRAYKEAKSFEEWSFKPVGTGPFKVKELIPYDKLVLEAHEGYWGGKPAVGTLVFKAVPEASARIAGLMAGDYQVISDVSIDMIRKIEADKNLEVMGGPSASFLATFFNMHKPYMDVKLRRALSLALDRELLVKTLFAGRTVVPNGLQDPSYGPMYVKDHPYPRYDLKLAQQMVKESKYKGEAIPYHIQNNYYPNEVDAAQAMVEMWRAAGINVQIEVKENWAQVNVEDQNKIRIYGMRNVSHTDLFMDPSGCMWRTYNPKYEAQAKHNWDPGDFNKWGKILDTSIDQKERYDAFKKMLEYFDENPPAMVLYQNVVTSAKRKNIDWSAYKQVYMYFGPENFRQ
ncbi:MAG: ABC transporter substrate-binding protein [Desulfobacteraceae bacterium]|nr:MAG: ABC transporter substrate-binding protein [Desulfobacteraceae bacterium]